MGFIMICDRCTKPITGNLDDKTSMRVRAYKWPCNPSKEKPVMNADLCASCLEAVKDFIFDHKEGVAEEKNGA